MFDTSRVSDDAIEEIVAGVRRRFDMKPKVALAGFGKSGKSSLFNAIYGAKVAKVSMRTDETTEADTHERFGVDFTDTPGIGTSRFSLEKVEQMGVLDRQNVILHVLNGAAAISAEDERLHELIERSSARRVTVVNKVDILDDVERAEYAQSVQEKLGLPPGDLFFVSAKHGTGVPALVHHIADVIPDAMQDAFIAQQQGDLALKERRVRTLVYSKASLCAGVALFPIPVADITVITPIQIAMIAAIGYFHGVEVNRARAIELIATVGTGAGLREAARQLVKLVPGYGPAVSAAIAFAGTVALGETANVWFKNQMRLDADALRALFKKTAREAREAYERGRTADPQVVAQAEELRRDLEAGRIDQETFERRLAELGSKLG